MAEEQTSATPESDELVVAFRPRTIVLALVVIVVLVLVLRARKGNGDSFEETGTA